MTQEDKLAGIRREYGRLSLDDKHVSSSPVTQFKHWFSEVLATEMNDPTAMLLSTVDERGHPDSRVVLLKGFDDGKFIFYTNYQSNKAQHMQTNPNVALNFYWPQMVRQVRIRGQVQKISSTQSDEYFATRPLASQFNAILSPQSKEILSREELELLLNQQITEHSGEALKRPDYWGGYCVMPEEYEFWQGRDNRFHDRIHYYLEKNTWCHRRLAP